MSSIKKYDKKVLFFYFQFLLASSRTTVINDNFDNQQARAPSIRFCQPIEMYNPGEIKQFCPKSCYFKPPSDLMNVMQQLGPDLPYGRVPRPRAHNMVRLFLVFTSIWQEDAAKIPKVPGAPRIRPGNNMVSKRNHLMYHFSITIHLHLASFYAQNTFKKLARVNVHWTKYWIWIEGSWASWRYVYYYNWLISWKSKNL